jgi:hypothetical protein
LCLGKPPRAPIYRPQIRVTEVTSTVQHQIYFASIKERRPSVSPSNDGEKETGRADSGEAAPKRPRPKGPDHRGIAASEFESAPTSSKTHRHASAQSTASETPPPPLSFPLVRQCQTRFANRGFSRVTRRSSGTSSSLGTQLEAAGTRSCVSSCSIRFPRPDAALRWP